MKKNKTLFRCREKLTSKHKKNLHRLALVSQQGTVQIINRKLKQTDSGDLGCVTRTRKAPTRPRLHVRNFNAGRAKELQRLLLTTKSLPAHLHSSLLDSVAGQEICAEGWQRETRHSQAAPEVARGEMPSGESARWFSQTAARSDCRAGRDFFFFFLYSHNSKFPFFFSFFLFCPTGALWGVARTGHKLAWNCFITGQENRWKKGVIKSNDAFNAGIFSLLYCI